MSLEQYNFIMSNLLKEKHSLTKLREELEGRRGKLCFDCKGFRHLAQNCKKKKEAEKGVTILQNKFEALKSRVMQCKVEERMIRRVEVVEVEYFKCGEKGHKCKECSLWMRKEKAVHVERPQKAQQEEKPAYPIKEKIQEKERRLRRVEKREITCVAEP